MSYSKCKLCLKDREGITRVRYVRYLDWKQCPFFCCEDTIHGYHQCVRDRVIPDYKVQEGGETTLSSCRIPTMRVKI